MHCSTRLRSKPSPLGPLGERGAIATAAVTRAKDESQPPEARKPYSFMDRLDALVAAPIHHRLAYENERVRVLETLVLPGQTVPLHTHEWPAALYVLSGGDFVRRNAEGEVMLDSRAAGLCLEIGMALWSDPLGPHTLENVGSTPIRIIATELKPEPATHPLTPPLLGRERSRFLCGRSPVRLASPERLAHPGA